MFCKMCMDKTEKGFSIDAKAAGQGENNQNRGKRVGGKGKELDRAVGSTSSSETPVVPESDNEEKVESENVRGAEREKEQAGVSEAGEPGSQQTQEQAGSGVLEYAEAGPSNVKEQTGNLVTPDSGSKERERCRTRK
ncbi:hypothetical protein EOD39_3150 [Acipenser ruthenus]|uniref:Uncharacterized protein n=1 Tax=Acipenser ruthenus TaxID=7906 RepID=A0A444UPU2_ACIRT|nr:hypothetical protein EOD39_3150 [Acipenser ruthenus]